MSEKFGADYWEARYRAAEQRRGSAARAHPEPSPHLVELVGGSPPGRALEAGTGEGGNALWLAGQGWQVTAVDVSGTALRRAAEHADGLEPEVAGRVEWVRADLTRWRPEPAAYDLVTAHYVHPAMDLGAFLAVLTSAVAPGGMLLVVDHGAHEAGAHEEPGEHPDVQVTPEDLVGLLPGGTEAWTVEVAEQRTRTLPHGHGHGHGHGHHHGHGRTLHDSVVGVRRHGMMAADHRRDAR